MFSEVIVDPDSVHVALTAWIAASTWSLRSAAIAAKLPSWTDPTTPGIASASAKSMLSSVASSDGGRTTLPYTMPSTSMSMP